MVSTKRRSLGEKLIEAAKETIVVIDSLTPVLEKAGEILTHGSDVMDQAVKEPTLDLFLDRNPKTLNFPADYLAMTKVLRRQRELFITADAKRKDGVKKGMETPDDTPDTEEA